MPATTPCTPHSAAHLYSALQSLIALARHHRIAADADQLIHQHCLSQRGFDLTQLLLVAKDLGLQASIVQARRDRLAHMPLPFIAQGRDGRFSLIDQLDHPGLPAWNGTALLARPSPQPAASGLHGWRWFVPTVLKYRHLMGRVLLISALLQLLALLTPLFFQAVMDKVLVHRGLSTLDVLAIGMAGIVVFECALGGLRHVLFNHSAARIDAELGSRVMRHLLGLPAHYFQARRVGDSLARLRELDNVRGFLTGASLGAVLDVLFAFLFIAVMFAYSPWLTVVVLLSLPLYLVISLWLTPLLRARLDACARAAADNQAFLAETVTGVATVKSMAVQGPFIAQWNRLLAAEVMANFKARTLSVLAVEGVGFIGKAVTVATLWLGARLVMDGQLSVGQLIAFNLFAGRVSQPVLRLAQLWNQLQQALVSVRRVGDIIDTPTEQLTTAASPLSAVAGKIEFDQVSFRFHPDSSPVLRGISLRVAPGEVVGIVGPSGSGKSTLSRLLLRLHRPQSGRVLLDGQDLALSDAASLRRQIGVVLQDSLMFQRSVRDNIALSRPDATLAEVMEAAKLAGAHDFISALAHGYNTVVSERGQSLSGGQRQRLAIARALLSNPRVLILDEATSALDHESEQVITRNMAQICRSRTVIVIAHRLSALRGVDRILVLEAGRLVEEGSPSTLLGDPHSRYGRMHHAQQESCA